MCAISDKTLSSEVGFKGICRKVLIFLLVGIGHIVDAQVIGSGGVMRTAVILQNPKTEAVTIPMTATVELQDKIIAYRLKAQRKSTRRQYTSHKT